MLNFIDAEAGKRRVELDAAGILPFEERILATGRCGVALPAVFLTLGERRIARHDVTGYSLFSEYPFRGLDRALGVLYELPLLALEAEDRLLSADKFVFSAETLFVDAKTLRPGLIYGGADTGEGFFAGYASLLALTRTWEHITGLPEAARRAEERIRLENPDMNGLLRIIETVRREWNIIYPARS
jgi:hypothetical protein